MHRRHVPPTGEHGKTGDVRSRLASARPNQLLARTGLTSREALMLLLAACVSFIVFGLAGWFDSDSEEPFSFALYIPFMLVGSAALGFC